MNIYRVRAVVLFLIKTVEITAYIRTVDARENTAASRFG